MNLSLGFSSCPNDTFIFDAMVHSKIDTEGLSFSYQLADIEELNTKAFNDSLDIVKVSFHAYLKLVKDYVLLNSGSALGRNCGPLVIARQQCSLSDLAGSSMIIPGENTTANLLLSIFAPAITNKTGLIFSGIEDAVASGSYDAGLVIHESRFTYKEKGLVKIVDLGEIWEAETSLPIPLGGIIARRNLGDEMIARVNRVLRRSVKYAFDNPGSSREFVLQHSQDKRDEIVDQHINLYVNEFTLDLGREGQNAVLELFSRSASLGIIPKDFSRPFMTE